MIPEQLITTVTSNVWVRYVLILLLGITIGAIFYPTKTMKETISKQYEQQIQTINQQHEQELKQVSTNYQKTISTLQTQESESTQQIQELTTKVSDLQSHTTGFHRIRCR
jgi:uncharacterized membrane-anchored protein YhcB (DUF1043 family)